MKAMKALIIALAATLASAQVWASHHLVASDDAPLVDKARVGFFSIPLTPMAYSFADICNLTIEPNPVPLQGAETPPPANDLASVWSSMEFVPAAEERSAAAAPAADVRPVAQVQTLSLDRVPEPQDWMRLFVVAVLAFMVKRRRDWFAMRGFALDKPSRPTRPAAAGALP